METHLTKQYFTVIMLQVLLVAHILVHSPYDVHFMTKKLLLYITTNITTPNNQKF